MSDDFDVIIVGGGAAGFFCAAQLSEQRPGLNLAIMEGSSKFLTKVRISGGGRCNLTHHCFDARELSKHYPRGQRELLGPFSRFQPKDTIEWFERHGVPVVTESDGRMFPEANRSEAVIECLMNQCKRVTLMRGQRVTGIAVHGEGFELSSGEERYRSKRVLLATGGSKQGFDLAGGLGHSLHSPVPSLFTFHVRHPLLEGLAGVALKEVTLHLKTKDNQKFLQKGPLLITHEGLSGPAVLKLSAYAARSLFEQDYQAKVRLSVTPLKNEEEALAWLKGLTPTLSLKKINPGLPKRFWDRLLEVCELDSSLQLAHLSKKAAQSLSKALVHLELPIHGKTMNKEEFVTCGGVDLKEVNLKTMESKKVPGLFFAGEVLNVDGVTGGFNFQNAWTTAYLAAQEILRQSGQD